MTMPRANMPTVRRGGCRYTKVGTFTQALYEPLLADLAHSNRIADGLTRSSHVVQPPLFRSDDDGARRDRFLHRHHVAATVRRFDSRQTGSAEGRCQEYKQKFFSQPHPELLQTKMFRMSVAVGYRVKSRTRLHSELSANSQHKLLKSGCPQALPDSCRSSQ